MRAGVLSFLFPLFFITMVRNFLLLPSFRTGESLRFINFVYFFFLIPTTTITTTTQPLLPSDL